MPAGDTIAAIATPQGSGAIGIVRLSGPEAVSVADTLVRRPGVSLAQCRSHRAVRGVVIDPTTGEELDDVVVISYREPNSYTGEDMVEICCHGGSYLLSRVLGACLDSGARMASPGEFTYRAFLNGKLDLAQAEAVADLISARTSAALRAANRLRAGALSEIVVSLRDELLDACSSLEAAIETDDEDTLDATASLQGDLARLAGRIDALLTQARAGRALREGYRVAIVGRPNVGKSTLFNALLRRSRAIVSPAPGTTRDTIEETVEMGGLAVTFIDTAGLRRARGIAETIGLQRTQQAVDEADAVLLVLAAGRAPSEPERELASRLGDRCVAWVINKTDMLPPHRLARALARLQAQSPSAPLLGISAITGEGLPELEKRIVQSALGPAGDSDHVLVTHERHVRALQEAMRAVGLCRECLTAGIPMDVAALYLREAADSLAHVIGTTVPEDVIGRLFSRFCMGK